MPPGAGSSALFVERSQRSCESWHPMYSVKPYLNPSQMRRSRASFAVECSRILSRRFPPIGRTSLERQASTWQETAGHNARNAVRHAGSESGRQSDTHERSLSAKDDGMILAPLQIRAMQLPKEDARLGNAPNVVGQHGLPAGLPILV